MKRSKTTVMIALFLMLAIAISLVSFSNTPFAEAEDTMTTYAFLGAMPNPVGVGQEVLLHVGITQQLGLPSQSWEGLTVTVTKPDGTKDTLGPYSTDATGGTGGVFVPDMAGEYTLQTHFPEQVFEEGFFGFGGGGIPAGTTMLASDSEELTLVVNADPIAIYPGVPLPTEYWTRPINAQLREWAPIAGSWPGVPTDRFVTGNDDAPETGHILWTKPIAMGGLVGGDIGQQAMECGAAYEQKFGAPTILNGILYYNRYQEQGRTNVEQEVVAVDLHTGEELWVRNWNNTRLSIGQLFYFDSWNYHGTFAYLWSVTGRTWDAYDAFTGRWAYRMTNVPATTASYGGSLGSNSFFGPKGEIYAYTVDLNNGWMTLWNSSRVVQPQTSGGPMDGSWQPLGKTYDASTGIDWNITIPTTLSGSVCGFELGERVVGRSVTTDEVNIWAISLKPGQEGTLLFNKSWDAPASWASNMSISWSTACLAENVGLVWAKETRQWWGFSLETGSYLWGPTESEHYLGIYGTSTAIADGRLYQCYMSGILYCYNITTGELLWTYEAKDPLNEILWGNNWPMRIQFVVDGKIYLVHGEHSPVDPKPRGGPMICLDAETGEEIWSMSMYYYYRTNVVIGDNIISLMNSYDQQVYAIGRGPSAITVSIQDDVITHGDSVLVKGIVTDISPGTEEYALTARFPNGVPAVSDANMSKWMEYVYMQFPRPTDITGVEVKISVLDPNGNYYDVGTATSDASGLYSCMFTPLVPGEYTVVATFEGSKAYYGSFAETAIGVLETPAATPCPTPTPAPMTDTYVLGIGAGSIIAIIAIGLVVILMLRKR
ncbi:PQQ-binding-like beta-propeller repeat protein [Candidatus Bathyarchaeota archaeon]|nr:PQQ-binding-like beta-propeller repeat protein [Candidatus Bathyarchaeota archaeon]